MKMKLIKMYKKSWIELGKDNLREKYSLDAQRKQKKFCKLIYLIPRYYSCLNHENENLNSELLDLK